MKKGLILIIVTFVIISLSVGFSIYNAELMISGDAVVRSNNEIRITNIQLLNTNNDGKENYSPKYSKDTTTISILLPNQNSTVTYEIEVENKSDDKYLLENITENSYTNKNISYRIEGISTNEIIEANSKKIFTITFYYEKDINENIENTIILKYEFRKYNENDYLVVNLSEEMIPVKYIEKVGWVKTTEDDTEWYDYTKQQWANVVLDDATFQDDILVEEEPYSMFVYIPRYAYKISNWHSNNPGNIDIVFLNEKNQDMNGKKYQSTYEEAINGLTSNEEMNNYVVHPAFTFENKELNGIWVGKFESSFINAPDNKEAEGYNGTDRKAQIKGGVSSWRGININNAFLVSKNFNSNLNSHLLKNSEWGAVAYLSKSKYGKNDEVWINPNSNYITGEAGIKVDDEQKSNTYNYKTINGFEASTTGNITGIYDMSGGSWEYVSAYLNNNHENLNLFGKSLVETVDSYKNVYVPSNIDDILNNYESNKFSYGDAIYETSENSSWYNDFFLFLYTHNPFFTRGGGCEATNLSGLFAFSHYHGDAYDIVGFRISLFAL